MIRLSAAASRRVRGGQCDLDIIFLYELRDSRTSSAHATSNPFLMLFEVDPSAGRHLCCRRRTNPSWDYMRLQGGKQANKKKWRKRCLIPKVVLEASIANNRLSRLETSLYKQSRLRDVRDVLLHQLHGPEMARRRTSEADAFIPRKAYLPSLTFHSNAMKGIGTLNKLSFALPTLR